MRTSAPIYTTQEILDETGFVMEMQDPDSQSSDQSADGYENEEYDPNHEARLDQYSIEELERTLRKYIDNEEYEKAAEVNEILKRKRNKDR